MNSPHKARSNDANPARAARILFADDLLSHRELIRFALESSGYEVIEAEDGEEALRRAPDFAPDLFILDLNMPKMNGCATATALRKIPAFTKTPIVALTVTPWDQFPADFGEAEFNEYLIKPVALTRLRQCISALL